MENSSAILLKRVWVADEERIEFNPTREEGKGFIQWREKTDARESDEQFLGASALTVEIVNVVRSNIESLVDQRFEFGLRLSLEEAITNIIRYGGPLEGSVDVEHLRVELVIEEIVHDGERSIRLTLSFFDQGPNLQYSPAVYAEMCRNTGQEEEHGRGFALMKDLAGFDVEAKPRADGEKVIRLTREFKTAR